MTCPCCGKHIIDCDYCTEPVHRDEVKHSIHNDSVLCNLCYEEELKETDDAVKEE